MTVILFQTNMPVSHQNNARHQSSINQLERDVHAVNVEKPEKLTGNRRFFTPSPTSFPGFSPNRPYLPRSVGTCRRELWERGCFFPRLAHRPKCRFHLARLIKRLLNGLIIIPRTIRISSNKVLSRSACTLTAAYFARNH